MIGFGGEEGYLHEKVRRAGGWNLCLPWLRWWHRFNEFVPGAAPYLGTVEDKAWNYCVGWGELGWDFAPVREHFASLMPLERFDRIAEAAKCGDELPPHRTSSSFTSHASNIPEDCGCGGSSAVSAESTTDFAVYADRLRPFVERIGAGRVVYEHSANGSPAIAMLAELHPGKVISFSPNHDKTAFETFARHGKERITLISSAMKAPIYEADFIVLSGYADGHDLAPHLESAGEKSHQLIALGGTSQPDTVQRPSLMTAIRLFLRESPEWSVVFHDQKGSGLTILSRDEQDNPKLPGRSRWPRISPMRLPNMSLTERPRSISALSNADWKSALSVNTVTKTAAPCAAASSPKKPLGGRMSAYWESGR